MYIYVCMYVRVCLCVYLCMNMYIYSYMHIHIHILVYRHHCLHSILVSVSPCPLQACLLAPSTVAYNYAPNPDKQWILQYTSRMHDIQLKFTDLLMTKRLQTLQTVDEAVHRVG